jgi:hypothetical protein
MKSYEIGKVYQNKSHWNEDGKEHVKVIAHDPVRRRFYVQYVDSGIVDWVDESGKGEHFLCGGYWLIIDLKEV